MYIKTNKDFTNLIGYGYIVIFVHGYHVGTVSYSDGSLYSSYYHSGYAEASVTGY